MKLLSGFTLFITSSNLTFLLAWVSGGNKLRLGNFSWSFPFIGYARSPMQVYRHVKFMKGLSKSGLQIQLVQEEIIYESHMNIGTRDSKGQLHDPQCVQ